MSIRDALSQSALENSDVRPGTTIEGAANRWTPGLSLVSPGGHPFQSSLMAELSTSVPAAGRNQVEG